MDVLVTGLFVWYFDHLQRVDLYRTRERIWAALMPLLLFFSYAAFFVFWIGIVLLAARTRREGTALRTALVYLSVSAVSFVLIYFFDLRWTAQQPALKEYWRSYFICTDSAGCFFSTLGEGLRRIPAWSFGKGKVFLRWGSFLIPFFLYGLGRYGIGGLRRLGKNEFDPYQLGGVLFLELFILGAIKIFPFTGDRITLFFVAFVLLYIVRALSDLNRFRPGFYFFLMNFIVYLVACLGNSILLYSRLYLN